MRDDDLPLTAEEIAQGWHFCPEWDELLIGPGMSELEDFLDPESMTCLCNLKLPETFKPRRMFHADENPSA